MFGATLRDWPLKDEQRNGFYIRFFVSGLSKFKNLLYFLVVFYFWARSSVG